MRKILILFCCFLVLGCASTNQVVEETEFVCDRGMRTTESVRKKVEIYKGYIYLIYKRFLDKNPELSGEFIFEFIIEASGATENLTLLKSDLTIENINSEFMSKLQEMNFGEEDVCPRKIRYKYNFIPAPAVR